MMKTAVAMGNWWLAASSWQCTCSCTRSHAECLGKTSNHPGDLTPLQPRLGALPQEELLASLNFAKSSRNFWQNFWLFLKLKSTLKGKRFQTIHEIQENIIRKLMVILPKDFCSVLNSGIDSRRTVWGVKVPTLKGTKTSLSCVQCFLYLLQQMSPTFHGWILSGQTSYL